MRPLGSKLLSLKKKETPSEDKEVIDERMEDRVVRPQKKTGTSPYFAVNARKLVEVLMEDMSFLVQV